MTGTVLFCFVLILIRFNFPARGWSDDGKKCTTMPIDKAKSLGPCNLGCSCVPPASSYNYLTHSTVSR